MCPCVLTLLLLGVVGALVYLYLTWNFDYWRKRGVKGPEPEILYGNMRSIVKRDRHMALELQDIYEKYKKSGERFIGIFMTRRPEILVIDPLLARDILVKNFNSFRKNEAALWTNSRDEKISVINPFFGAAHDWKDRRADVVGGISPSKLKLAYPIVRQSCNKMTNYIRDVIAKGGNPVETKTVCYNYTLETMADFLWGINADAFKTQPAANTLLKMSQSMLEKSLETVGLYYFSKFAPIIKTLSKRRLFALDVDEFFSRIQKDAVELRIRNPSDRSDFLNYVIQLQEKKNISHFDMVGYSLTVLLNGFETSALAMFHTLFYLAGNQNAQMKLREEILANIDTNGEISYDVLNELPYLNQCLNETIRLITPIPMFSRICSDKISIENIPGNAVDIEPGTIVHIPAYALHQDADTFPNPTEYRPERFDDNRAKELNQEGRFFPFGDGPRICAGMKLGQLEAKAGIFEIIRNFQLNATEDSENRTIKSSAFIIGLSGDLNIEYQPLTK